MSNTSKINMVLGLMELKLFTLLMRHLDFCSIVSLIILTAVIVDEPSP